MEYRIIYLIIYEINNTGYRDSNRKKQRVETAGKQFPMFGWMICAIFILLVKGSLTNETLCIGHCELTNYITCLFVYIFAWKTLSYAQRSNAQRVCERPISPVDDILLTWRHHVDQSYACNSCSYSSICSSTPLSAYLVTVRRTSLHDSFCFCTGQTKTRKITKKAKTNDDSVHPAMLQCYTCALQ